MLFVFGAVLFFGLAYWRLVVDSKKLKRYDAWRDGTIKQLREENAFLKGELTERKEKQH